MSGQILTDVDQFDATIEWPIPGEFAGANDTRDRAIQRLANRTRNNKNRLDGHDTDIADLETALAASHASAMYGFSGTAVASGSKFTLGLIRRSSTGFALSSNEVIVPSTGWYAVSWKDCASGSSSLSQLTLGAQVYVNSVAQNNVQTKRNSSSLTDRVNDAGTTLVEITNTSTHKISICALTGAGTMDVDYIPPAQGELTIVKVGEL